MPAFESSGYVRLVAFETVIYMVLALGLNLIVGWAGLLDLGYIAFFGVGSYVYAIFDSPKFGYHVPPIVLIPAATIIGALVGLLRRPPVAAPVRRLPGDHDAVLPRTVRDGRDQRQPDLRSRHHRRVVRDLERQPAELLRAPARSAAPGHLRGLLLLHRDRDVRDRLRRAALREPVPHGARLALTPRGRTGSRGDGDAGELAEASELRHGRRGRCVRRNGDDRAQCQRLSAQLLTGRDDHHLRDGDSRRARQPVRVPYSVRFSSASCCKSCRTRDRPARSSTSA